MAFRIGIDAGSKTIKVVVLDEGGNLLYNSYTRHASNITETLIQAVHELNWRFGAVDATIAMTGSAAIEVAQVLGLPFVQEVVATTKAVQTLVPDADAVIELGGEDAKIIYLTGGIEQRMNASCAGGTGGFIDTIAYMLDVDPEMMGRIAFGSMHKYPIASRCSVFAQSDVRPLLNAGVSKCDIAASVYEAVVRQTLGGLACGRPIQGKVVFLGGPFEHMSYLSFAFRRALGIGSDMGVKPKNAHLFTVMGAAICSDSEAALGCAPVRMNTAELEDRVVNMGVIESDLDYLEPLFASDEELAAFVARHDEAGFPRKRVSEVEGPLYVGIDAGSTTLKVVAISQDGDLVFNYYEAIRGDLIDTLRDALEQLYHQILPASNLKSVTPRVWIERCCATGYGEALLRAAFGVDMGVVETAAHLRAAQELCPDLTFLLDIGGQDMKALWVRDGVVVDAALNEACSSGCGAFIEGTAAALKSDPYDFADMALVAERPIDLGTKCTVFMNSRVKQAQKIGTPIQDIAAGIAYSVVKNAVNRIIGEDRAPGPDDKVVVQGGTFMSNAVLRAFELLSGVEAVRPREGELMGAVGCAFCARDATAKNPGQRSALIGPDEFGTLDPVREKRVCTGCPNACKLTILRFDDEGQRYFITDNKCERGLDELGRVARREAGEDVRLATEEAVDAPPNVVAAEQRILASYGDVEGEGPRGCLRIGLTDSMATFAYRPFWQTLFAKLGFGVALPTPGCENDQMSEAWETIPSESVCYPAKIAHVRYFDLCAKGCDAVFAPLFERGIHCAVQMRYDETLTGNVGSARHAENLVPLLTPELLSYKPKRFMGDEASVDNLLASINGFVAERAPEVSRDELDEALDAALEAQRGADSAIECETQVAFDWLDANPQRHGIVLAGRPYHMDDAVLHGIDRELERLGFAVLSASGLTEAMRAAKGRGASGAHPWVQGKRLVRLANVIASNPQLDVVFLQSFGCGYEPMSLAEAADVLDAVGKPCTILMIDDISDLAHIRIRLRTLEAAINLRDERVFERALAPDSAPSQCRCETRVPKDAPADGQVFSFLQSIAAEPLEMEDLEVSRRRCVKDVCFVADVMAARVIRMLEEDPAIERVELPLVCVDCILDAVPRIVERATGLTPEYTWVPWDLPTGADAPTSQPQGDGGKPRVALLGNPLMVFEPFMNDGIVEMLEELGCEPVLPDPELVVAEDIRYLDQLRAFEEAGITDVVYLLCFGCLKGHVQGRGALRSLNEMFPNMNITFIDYNPETSALNRENRVRLAIEAARSK